MKTIIKFTTLLIVFSVILNHADGTEYTKQFRKAWTRSSITALKINNKFGEVRINDMGGDSVTIKVVITVENSSAQKARELADKVDVNFDKSGSQASAETSIEGNFQSKGRFSIDYLINIPKDKELNVTNRYGNVILNELDAKGTFNISYGSMSAGNIKAPALSPLIVIVKYGKADFESINDADMEIKYSKLISNAINNLTLELQYSTVDINKMGKLNLNSKYDGIDIDEIDDLKSVSKYTHYKIGTLNGSFDLNTGYGSVEIRKVNPKFEKINITNSYGGININMADINYKLKADCDYCDIKYPKESLKGNKIKDNQHLTIDGTIGTGGGIVTVISKYGGIKLTE